MPLSERERTRRLLEFDAHELGWPYGRDAGHHVRDVVLDVHFRIGVRVTRDTREEIRFVWTPSLEGALLKEGVRIREGSKPNRLPQLLVLRFEEDPAQPAPRPRWRRKRGGRQPTSGP